MEQRSQKRTKAAIPVEIRAVDAKGETFDESVEAQDVSRRGLSFLTRHDLAMYASLSVVIPGRGPVKPGEGATDFFSTATVVRVEKAGELNRIGVRFVGATLSTYTAEST